MKALKLIINLCLALFIGIAVNLATGINPIAASATIFLVPLTLNYFNALPSGLAFMALQQEVWIRDVEDQLFPMNAFMENSIDHSAFIENKTIHIPQAGSNPGIVKNRYSLPATITERTDTELTYDLDEFTTDQILIRDLDELQTSYAKRQSVLRSHVEVLGERIGDETINNWAASGSAAVVISTTGATTADKPAGATGDRRKTLKEDVSRAAKKLDLDNVPRNGRFLLMPASMYYELFDIDALVRKDFGQAASLITGVVNTLFGFNVMIRSFTIIFNGTTLVKKAVGAAGVAATDAFGAIGWQRSAVAKANLETKVFADEDKPEFYGSVLSALKQHGSSKMRSDDKGIVSIVQAIA